jgi:hypothetical protein
LREAGGNCKPSPERETKQPQGGTNEILFQNKDILVTPLDDKVLLDFTLHKWASLLASVSLPGEPAKLLVLLWDQPLEVHKRGCIQLTVSLSFGPLEIFSLSDHQISAHIDA